MTEEKQVVIEEKQAVTEEKQAVTEEKNSDRYWSSLDRSPTERDFSLISTCIDHGWENLAFSLGLSYLDIDDIKHNSESVLTRILQVLVEWKSRQETPTLFSLFKIMRLVTGTGVLINWSVLMELFGHSVNEDLFSTHKRK